MASRRSAIVAAVVALATVAVTAGSAVAGEDDRPPNAGPPSSVGRPSNPGNSRNSRPPSPPGQASASGGAPQVDAPASTAPRNPVAATAPQVDAPASTAPLNAVAAAAPAVDECAGPSTAGAASPSDRFWTAACARRNATGPLEDQLGMPAPTRQSAEQDRVAMCSPGFEFPNREQVADSWRLTIREVTRDNPALGERLLDDGVLTAFEHQRLQDGTLLFDIAYNMDAVNVLVDADLQLFAWFIENRAAVCAGNP